jgi:hypothetical protein
MAIDVAALLAVCIAFDDPGPGYTATGVVLGYEGAFGLAKGITMLILPGVLAVRGVAANQRLDLIARHLPAGSGGWALRDAERSYHCQC